MRQSDGQVVFLYAHWGQLFYIDIGLPVQASALPGGNGGRWGDREEGWKSTVTIERKVVFRVAIFNFHYSCKMS
jgi:hypothetical protein